MGVPPGHVGGVAKGAAHYRAGAFFRVSAGVGQNGHALVEVGHDGVLVDEVLETAVFGMDEHRHAGGQQFRAGGGNGQRLLIFQPEGQSVKGAVSFQVVQFGLGDGRLAFRAPDGRRLLAVGQPLFVQIEE